MNDHNIFNKKYADETFIYSLNDISKEINEKNLDNLDVSRTDTLEQRERNGLFDYF